MMVPGADLRPGLLLLTSVFSPRFASSADRVAYPLLNGV
jgi:hypothetical protein